MDEDAKRVKERFFLHQPVLLEEFLSLFENRSIRFFVDGTLGAGGHAEALLRRHPEIELLIGCDQDTHALALAKERLQPWKEKLALFHARSDAIAKILQSIHIASIDGMLLDLGVSSMQLDEAGRGFSFSRSGPLDMRMNPTARLTAEEIVNNWSEKELGRIFREWGEEPKWRLAARLLVEARVKERITTTEQLTAIWMPRFPRDPKKQRHPLTLLFQGLRIAVNDELTVLQNTLDSMIPLIHRNGVFAVMSFHSLEDRIVKEKFQWEASDKWSSSGLSGLFVDKKPTLTLLTKKPIEASEEEIKVNPRSRSAKLRAAERWDG